MPPPQLARNGPIMNVAHPVEINLAVVRRREADVIFLDNFDRALRQGLNLDEPLRREPRLNNRSAPVTFSNRERVIFFSNQKPMCAQIFQNTFAGGRAAKPCIGPGVLVHAGVLVHDFDLQQIVANSRLKIVGIVCGRDLHRASAELGLCEFIGDDRDLAIHQRQQNSFSVQVGVALIALIHRNRSIAEHGFGARCGDGDKFVAIDDRVANFPQLARNLLVLDFEIRDCRLAARAPVDDVLPAIDQALLMQPNEHLAHRSREVVIHGEVFAAPID